MEMEVIWELRPDDSYCTYIRWLLLAVRWIHIRQLEHFGHLVKWVFQSQNMMAFLSDDTHWSESDDIQWLAIHFCYGNNSLSISANKNICYLTKRWILKNTKGLFTFKSLSYFWKGCFCSMHMDSSASPNQRNVTEVSVTNLYHVKYILWLGTQC